MAKKKAVPAELKSINAQIVNIELLGLIIERKQVDIPAMSLLNFNIGIEQRIDSEKRLVTVVLNISVANNPKNEQVYFNIITGCTFELEEIESLIDEKTQLVNLPEQVAVLLNSISISTTRGIMFSELKGTYLQGAILPIVDPRIFTRKN